MPLLLGIFDLVDSKVCRHCGKSRLPLGPQSGLPTTYLLIVDGSQARRKAFPPAEPAALGRRGTACRPQPPQEAFAASGSTSKMICREEEARGGSAYPSRPGNENSGVSVMIQGKIRQAGTRGESVMASLLSAVALVLLQAAATPTPIKLAIFAFELEDTSAGASSTVAADTMQLTSVTNDVRQLFEQSRHYIPIDGSTADADAARAHMLRDCNGCAAAIARQLGADQSFVGVVRRVSRTEYAVRFQIRDARTGTIISEGDSGLRMGADYSWS